MSILILEKDGYNTILKELQEIKKLLESSKKDQAQKDKWLNVNEVAKILDVTTRSLQSYRDRRMISFTQFGSKILFRAEDVEDFLMRHHIKRKEG